LRGILLLSSRPSAGALLNLLDAALSAIASASLPPTTQRGTTSSNPSPSSGESTANLAVAHGSERRWLNGNRNEPCCTRRDPHIGFGVRCSVDYDQIRRTDQIVRRCWANRNREEGSGLAGSLATGTATTLSRSFTTMITLFFLLASGDRLLRGFVEVLPRFKDKRTAVEIADEIEENISGYLLTITMMNALVGVATGIAMKLCGLGDPILWGVMAFLLNYIPSRSSVAIFKIVADGIEPLKPIGHIIGS
jgi:hypothetical protein